MNITPRTPKSQFDFVAAISQLFTTPGGVPWALKLSLATGLLLSLVYAVGGFLIAAPYMSMISSIDTFGQDTDEALSTLWAMVPGYTLLMLGSLAAYAMGEATLHRAILREADTPGIPLRFGKDELRVFGASLSVFILAFLAFLGVVFLAAIIGGILSVAVPTLGIIVIALAYIGGLLIWPFVAIRLAPAAGLSVYNDQMHVMAGRHVSKHRFWNMFLAYLVVGIVGYVASTIISLLGMTALIGDGSIFLATGGELGDGNGEDIAAKLGEMFSNPLVIIATLIAVALYSCVTAAWMLSMAGIASYTVKWWAEEDQVSTFD